MPLFFSLYIYHFNKKILQKQHLSEVDNWHRLHSLHFTHSVAQFCLLLLLIMQMPCPFIFAQWCQICGAGTAKKINNAQHWIHRKQVSTYTGMTVISCNPEEVYYEACISLSGLIPNPLNFADAAESTIGYCGCILSKSAASGATILDLPRVPPLDVSYQETSRVSSPT